MDTTDFRKHGKEMVDYIADYMENISERPVVPSIEPGYLRKSLPTAAPGKAETFEQIMEDVEKHIMPGITHWQHPHFHAYFPSGTSYPSIIANMLSAAIGCVGFSWAACPASTELDMIVLDWFGKMIGLPDEFLPFTPNGRGGGVIQCSASVCILVSLMAARFDVIKELKKRFPFVEEGILLSRLVAYCSKEAHSAVEKACTIAMVKLRIVETDKKYRLRGKTLLNAIREDRDAGLVPFFVSTTLGTTSCCSFDVLSEIGPVCTAEQMWLHVDAAYAGPSFMCPEFKYLMDGIQHVMSFNTNPTKWMMVNYECSTMWVKDRFKLTQAFIVDPLYLQHGWMNEAIDYRHWGLSLGRPFRSLKLWFVIRMYGIEGLQKHIRDHVRLAKKFEQLVRSDNRFQIMNDVILGLVCFRLKATDQVNERLLTMLNSSGKIHMVPAALDGVFVIRFCVCAEKASDKDIITAWQIITKTANQLLELETIITPILEEEEEEEEEEAEETGGSEVEAAGGIAVTRQTKGSIVGSQSKDINESSHSFLVRKVSDTTYDPNIIHKFADGRKLSKDLRKDISLMRELSMSMKRQPIGQYFSSIQSQGSSEESGDEHPSETENKNDPI